MLFYAVLFRSSLLYSVSVLESHMVHPSSLRGSPPTCTGVGPGQPKRRKVVVYARDGSALRKGTTVVQEEQDWDGVKNQLEEEFKNNGMTLQLDGVRFYGKSGEVILTPKVMFMDGEATDAVDLYTSEEDAKKGRPTLPLFLDMIGFV
jgi:hypothetical protein